MVVSILEIIPWLSFKFNKCGGDNLNISVIRIRIDEPIEYLKTKFPLLAR